MRFFNDEWKRIREWAHYEQLRRKDQLIGRAQKPDSIN